jgi:hypothetical protein
VGGSSVSATLLTEPSESESGRVAGLGASHDGTFGFGADFRWGRRMAASDQYISLKYYRNKTQREQRNTYLDLLMILLSLERKSSAAVMFVVLKPKQWPLRWRLMAHPLI